MEEDLHGGFNGSEEDVHRELEHDSAYGAANDDHGRSGLSDLSDAATFSHHAGKNADDSESDTTDTGEVHGSPLPFVKLLIRWRFCVPVREHVGLRRVPTWR